MPSGSLRKLLNTFKPFASRFFSRGYTRMGGDNGRNMTTLSWRNDLQALSRNWPQITHGDSIQSVFTNYLQPDRRKISTSNQFSQLSVSHSPLSAAEDNLTAQEQLPVLQIIENGISDAMHDNKFDSIDDYMNHLKLLYANGHRDIEICRILDSDHSNKKVSASDVIRRVCVLKSTGKYDFKTSVSVNSVQGLELALAAKGFDTYIGAISTSLSFHGDNKQNAHYLLDNHIQPILTRCEQSGVSIRVGIDCIGKVSTNTNLTDYAAYLSDIVTALFHRGANEVTFIDRVGVCTPEVMGAIVHSLKEVNIPMNKISLQLSNLRDTALENIAIASEAGITRIQIANEDINSVVRCNDGNTRYRTNMVTTKQEREDNNFTNCRM